MTNLVCETAVYKVTLCDINYYLISVFFFVFCSANIVLGTDVPELDDVRGSPD